MYTSTSNTPRPTSTRPRSPETFLSSQQRNTAASILKSYDRLSEHALQRSESLAQTRLHFLSMLAGFTAQDENALVDWKTDTAPLVHPQEERRKGSSGVKGKERERASLGGASPGGKGKERDRGSPAGGSGGGSGRKKRRSAGVGS